MNDDLVFSVSDFVRLLNQTLDYAYPSVLIVGELSNLRISKGKWVYFDLKDEHSSVKFFGTVYQLPGPLEDGMMLQIRGVPRLHNQFGFSVNVQFMQPVGEGSLRKAADLLEAKLNAEGLFDPARKRPLPYPPQRIGLITSGESAAYHDFIKIMNERWGGVDISLADVQVQGEPAVGQIVAAIEHFNSHEQPVEVLVITRGGGSADDLAAFSSEQVTRAVAGSRIPTIVAIGHEVDISLAELAADQRASTPSNAAQLLVPDKKQMLVTLQASSSQLTQALDGQVQDKRVELNSVTEDLQQIIERFLKDKRSHLERSAQLLKALSPADALKRGYVVLRVQGKVIKSVKALRTGETIDLELQDGTASAQITKV